MEAYQSIFAGCTVSKAPDTAINPQRATTFLQHIIDSSEAYRSATPTEAVHTAFVVVGFIDVTTRSMVGGWVGGWRGRGGGGGKFIAVVDGGGLY